MSRRNNGSINTKQKVIDEVREIMNERNLTKIPTSNYLNKIGESSVGAAVYKLCGGFVSLRKEFGEEIIQKRGMWSLEYTLEQTRKVMDSLNVKKLPTQRELIKIGRQDLLSAISEHHKGFSNFRKILGEKVDTRPRGCLKDKKYIISEVNRIMQEKGFTTLPSQQEFSRLGESSIAIAISKYHGGFNKLRKEFGEKNVRESGGTWKDLDYCIGVSKKLLKEYNLKQLPNNVRLRELGYASLSSAISKYHKGYFVFRKKLGENDKTLNGAWKNLDYCINQAKMIMNKHKTDTLPGSNTLIKLGYGTLVTSLHKYHKGMRKFREILGQEQVVAQVGSWKDLDYTIKVSCEFLKKHPEYDTIPSHNILIKNGYSGLSSAIGEYHKGFPEFRIKLDEHLGRSNQSKSAESLLEGYVAA